MKPSKVYVVRKKAQKGKAWYVDGRRTRSLLVDNCWYERVCVCVCAVIYLGYKRRPSLWRVPRDQPRCWLLTSVWRRTSAARRRARSARSASKKQRQRFTRNREREREREARGTRDTWIGEMRFCLLFIMIELVWCNLIDWYHYRKPFHSYKVENHHTDSITMIDEWMNEWMNDSIYTTSTPIPSCHVAVESPLVCIG